MKRIKQWVPNFPVDKNKFVNFSMLQIGSRRSGKSYLFNYMYKKYYSKFFDLIVIITTEMNVESFREIIPDAIIESNLNKAKNIIRALISVNKRIKSKTQIKLKKPMNLLVLFDDTASRKQRSDPFILDLYARGRHYNISVIYLTQSLAMADTVWRNNSDIIIIHKQNIMSEYVKISENLIYGFYQDVVFPQRWKLKKYYLDLVKDIINEKPYQCLIIDFVNNRLSKFKGK